MSDECVIETRDLTKRFKQLKAVQSLSLRVASGQITGFLGRNGAGKTTTIKMLLGMIHPTSGSGTVLGQRIDVPKESVDMRRHVAYVGEDKQLYPYMTVEELIRFTKSFYSDWQSDLERQLLKRYELPLHRKIKFLSKGMRTKLALLVALARRPALLILDEPSEGLDPVSVEDLLQSLVAAAGEGTTVFFSSHQIEEVERLADRICLIDRGKLLMDFSLDEFRMNYRRVILGFAEQSPGAGSELFRLAGIDHVRTDGRQITILASRNSEAVLEHARSWGAVSIDVQPISLREMFLEKVGADA